MQVTVQANEIVTPTFGLIGPGGVLPRNYSALVDAEDAAALDRAARLPGHAVAPLHRPLRQGRREVPPDPRPQAGRAGAGGGRRARHAPPRQAALETPLEAILYHAGSLVEPQPQHRAPARHALGGDRRRGPDRGVRRRLDPAAGAASSPAWPARGQPGRYVQLGEDATIGSQVWDPSARFLDPARSPFAEGLRSAPAGRAPAHPAGRTDAPSDWPRAGFRLQSGACRQRSAALAARRSRPGRSEARLDQLADRAQAAQARRGRSAAAVRIANTREWRSHERFD